MADVMLEARNAGGAYRRVEAITGLQRRQNWPAEEKARIVLESLNPEAPLRDRAPEWREPGNFDGLATTSA
jgi:transposase